MIYCSVKYCCSNRSIPGVIVHSIMKSIKTPNHPAYHWSILWPLEVWVRGLYTSWWFCVHKLSMFIYLSVEFSDYHQNLPFFTEKPSPCYMKLVCHCLPSIASMALITSVFATIDLASRGLSSCRVPKLLPKITPGFYFTLLCNRSRRSTTVLNKIFRTYSNLR